MEATRSPVQLVDRMLSPDNRTVLSPNALAGFSPITIALMFVLLMAAASIPILTHPLPPLADYVNHLARTEVINEIEVTDEGGIGAYARDTAIVTELRSKLLFGKDIQSVNYSIESVNNVVYLLGVAQDQAELDKAIDIARNVRYVRRVVSHVLMKDDPRRFRAPAA